MRPKTCHPETWEKIWPIFWGHLLHFVLPRNSLRLVTMNLIQYTLYVDLNPVGVTVNSKNIASLMFLRRALYLFEHYSPLFSCFCETPVQVSSIIVSSSTFDTAVEIVKVWSKLWRTMFANTYFMIRPVVGVYILYNRQTHRLQLVLHLGRHKFCRRVWYICKVWEDVTKHHWKESGVLCSPSNM